MSPRSAEDDVLAHWLEGRGRETLDLFVGGALDVIGVIDPELTVRYINWTTAGLTPEGVVGNSVMDLIPPGYADVAREAYLQVLRTGSGTRFETLYGEGEQVLQWDVRVGPIHVEGEVIGLIVVTSDVTEQRRAQVDRDRFFSLSLDMLVVICPGGHFKRVNPAFGETLGYDAATLIGTPFLDLVHPDDHLAAIEVAETVPRGVPIRDFENRYRHVDGEYRVFSWRGTTDPITGDTYAVARDVTEHRVIEAQLRQAQKMDAVGQLAGGVAHDFNNLLLAVVANAELAMDSVAQPSDGSECLDEIIAAARRAADLTAQLLTFSRRQAFRPVLVDLNKLFGGLTMMLRRLLPENITVDVIAGQGLASVNADPTQLEQILVNLCLNARDAIEGGGRLTIETENVVLGPEDCELHPRAKPGRYVLVSVSDTGAGMSDTVRERVFEPFFTTKRAHGGTGLGLSTVYGIVEAHGGMVRVDSVLGEGATFRVYLPADSRVAPEVRDHAEAVPPSGRETILVAEDEDQVRKPLVRILERAGYRTITARNGREAIRVLGEQEEPVDLVLLDVVMPEMDGPEAWEQMRRSADGLRVLFMSGYADEPYLENLPPDAEVLGKPFMMERILRRIRKKLDE